MPPRLPQLLLPCSFRVPSSTASTSLLRILLRPQQHQPHVVQHRNASILSSLSDNPGSYNKRIRRGRGPSAGKGKTSGRGHGGQKQHGKVPFRTLLGRFNGGQTPDIIVHGKSGFENQFSIELSTVNIDRIQSWIDQGRLDSTKPITIRELKRSQCISKLKDGVKLLAKNAETLHTPIHITVSRASASAIAAIEAAGGTVQTRYYTKASMKRVLDGETHPTLSLLSRPSPPPPPPAALSSSSSSTSSSSTTSNTQQATPPHQKYKYRLPDPASRKDLEYYRDPAHRGYLAYQLQAGQGPSLFFKTPAQVALGAAGAGGAAGGGVGKRKVRTGAAGGGKAKENSLW